MANRRCVGRRFDRSGGLVPSSAGDVVSAMEMTPPFRKEVTMSKKKEQVTTEVNELSPLRSATLAGDHTPARILLAPWGHVESTNGSFVVDEEQGEVRFNGQPVLPEMERSRERNRSN